VIGYDKGLVFGQAELGHQVQHAELARVLGDVASVEDDVVVRLGLARVRWYAGNRSRDK
jgi:hypothetical protein